MDWGRSKRKCYNETTIYTVPLWNWWRRLTEYPGKWHLLVPKEESGHKKTIVRLFEEMCTMEQQLEWEQNVVCRQRSQSQSVYTRGHGHSRFTPEVTVTVGLHQRSRSQSVYTRGHGHSRFTPGVTVTVGLHQRSRSQSVYTRGQHLVISWFFGCARVSDRNNCVRYGIQMTWGYLQGQKRSYVEDSWNYRKH